MCRCVYVCACACRAQGLMLGVLIVPCLISFSLTLDFIHWTSQQFPETLPVSRCPTPGLHAITSLPSFSRKCQSHFPNPSKSSAVLSALSCMILLNVFPKAISRERNTKNEIQTEKGKVVLHRCTRSYMKNWKELDNSATCSHHKAFTCKECLCVMVTG